MKYLQISFCSAVYKYSFQVGNARLVLNIIRLAPEPVNCNYSCFITIHSFL